ncbi:MULTISPECIES: dihydrodipicolinate synthase family protein [Rhizobium]|uniref:dihydrodipicolinate synthase family protein n=1 Tax=Rhizobium TaxID=379 RepID=UPI001B32AE52|nr:MULTISPECIES: dihydrodipicolinate synthase family protein [Rhizobium]MBX4910685.1 dihydrodipicolinate synthase family protein [Rhizobium bangladeshense]MBX5218253.1 dihydrodipicolinate synthase family protein [Rhizobium sp. NLR9a]MBX5224281.1 dihydrodipicolinate synthase family protein [Rhizobium sp. NLR8a]MBX5229802.1 dihydrodipicolinate synthase family protein [Rhizobium sp. NLR9b]MBX5235977.1 dihydrodipicolinate synthase family protein [Rhizobium sp. NLR4a]
MSTINLPLDGKIVPYALAGTPIELKKRDAKSFPRIAFAAAHVVADPLADNDPWLTPAIDWERTLAFRHRLWDLGLGVAEAMDTAQRGMGLGWPEARDLIRRALAEAAGRKDALIACGAGTDHLSPGPDVTIDTIIRAYEEQIETVEAAGGRIILMASRALAVAAKGPDDYIRVYDRILRQVKEPVIIHWLGEMFDPALEGYWGNGDHLKAMETCLQVIEANAAKVDGIKISLLSKEKEVTMRRQLPRSVRMYTGDDFNYAELIAGDEEGHSDALLGIFDAIAPAASAALDALGRKSNHEFFDLLEPTVPLSRHIFKTPTRFYKTGVVFLAYLNGLQDHFVMVGGQQSTRSLAHLAELFRLADKARVLADPELAASRMRQVLAVHGVN